MIFFRCDDLISFTVNDLCNSNCNTTTQETKSTTFSFPWMFDVADGMVTHTMTSG